MTRINIINVSELTDQHLIAEYREITMVPAALNRTINSRNGLDINNIPKLSGRQEKVYTLIRKRTIQSLMTNAIVNTYKFTAFVNDNYSFVNTP